MSSWPYSDDSLRAMYRGGRADTTARRLARLWAAVFALGLAPRRWVTLEVTGRRSGLVVWFPLGMARHGGRWYLVSMLGEDCNWVRNVRAAGGRATLRHGRAVRCRLTEVPVSERAPVMKRYLEQVPGARPHIPVDRRAPVSDFEAIAPRYPVFRVGPLADPARAARKRHWWRWVMAGALALVLLLVLAVGLFVRLQPSPAPLALPRGAARPPRRRHRPPRRPKDLWPCCPGPSTLIPGCRAASDRNRGSMGLVARSPTPPRELEVT